MTIFPRKLTRRAVIQTTATTFALPFLESFADILPLDSSNQEAEKPTKKIIFLYIPNGVIQKQWEPKETGNEWQLSPTLAPLEEFKSEITVISGLERKVITHQAHGQACCCWLSSTHQEDWKEGSYPIGRTLDQLIGDRMGTSTLYHTLTLSCNDFTDNNESAYFDTISWKAPGRAATAEKDPRVVFNRLFKVTRQGHALGSILDAVLSDVKSLQRKISSSDTKRLDEFMEGVRSAEQLIQNREKNIQPFKHLPFPEPETIPERRGDYIRLMCRLISHAFEMDLTRVATLLIDPERWSSPRMFHGVFNSAQNHHMLTHSNNPDDEEKVANIDRFHVTLFRDLIRELKSKKGHSGNSLFSDCLVFMGSGLGEGFNHSFKNLPVLLAGNGANNFKMGQHIQFPSGANLDNLWLTINNVYGTKAQSYANSDSEIKSLLR